jgi:hypothetical protein
MIENGSDLSECEEMLARECQKVPLIGEIEAPGVGFDRLKVLIRQRISADPRYGTRVLKREAPTCLACFLVWVGLVGYEDGDYWSAVQEFTGLPDTPYWERRWGRFFLNFLKSRDLPRFDIEGGHTYVTPILTHGGIPNSCLGEYFEEIVLPMVQRDLLDPSESEEVRQELSTLRQYHQERKPLEQERAALLDRVRSLENELDHTESVAAAFSDITELWNLEQDAESLDIPEGLPSDYERFAEEPGDELDTIAGELVECEQRAAQCEEVVAAFRGGDKEVLAHAERIAAATSRRRELEAMCHKLGELTRREEKLVDDLAGRAEVVLTEPWDDEYGESLTRLPFDQLRDLTRQLGDTVSRQKRLEAHLNCLATAPSPTICSTPAFLSILSSLVMGAGLVTAGVVMRRSWVLSAVGATLAGAGAIGFLARHQRLKEERRQRETLESRLSEVASTRKELHRAVVDLVAGLPIAQAKLDPPSSQLPGRLAEVAQTYQQLDELRGRHRELAREITRRSEQIDELAATLGLDSADDPVRAMEQRLRGARERKEAAAHSQAELQEEIRPKLEALKEKRQAVSDDLAHVQNMLADLGGGDVERGLERVEEQRRKQREAARLRTALKEKYSDFGKIEEAVQKVHAGAGGRASLQERVRRLREEVEQVRAELAEQRQRLVFYPTAFPRVDAPIRRYLVHAGAPAEAFLVHSVQLMHQTLSHGEVPKSDRLGVSGRVMRAFEGWWAEHGTQVAETDEAEDQQGTAGPRLRRPLISLDPTLSEIGVHLRSQRYRASGDETSALVRVVNGRSDSAPSEFPLRVYRAEADLLETQELEFPLPFPSEQYTFTLECDGDPIHSWEIEAMRQGRSWMAFDARSGSLVRDRALPRGKTWVVGKQLSFTPESCLLEKGSLHGRWKGYGFYALDLESVEELEITDGRGGDGLVPISSGWTPVLDVVGGQVLDGVRSDDAEVYVGPPPRVRVPVEERRALRLWRITVPAEECNCLESHCRAHLHNLEEATEFNLEEGWGDLKLDQERLLGEEPAGRFAIRVQKHPYKDWRHSFCVVPDLRVEFDEPIYMPRQTGQAPAVRATVETSEAATYVPQAPGEITDAEDGIHRLKVDSEVDSVSGVLRLPRAGDTEVEIPLTVDVPKVRWRLQGLEESEYATWRDTVEEVWLGDWATAEDLFLVVSLPSSAGKFVRLNLGDESQFQRRVEIQDGRARFDLLAFEDGLRAGPPVQTFSIALPDSPCDIESSPLLRVRTRWEVADLECIQKTRDQNIVFEVSWTERGRRDGKQAVVRLWSTDGAVTDPIAEHEVGEGMSATLEADVESVPAGTYLLQLALVDPWATTEFSRPERGTLNTKLVEVFPVEDVGDDELVELRAIADYQGREHTLERGAYRIKVIGRINYLLLPAGITRPDVLVTRTNEGWYVGLLEGGNDPELVADARRSNPVKFEYEAGALKITGIEDRYGEGPMYCAKCEKLFWSEELIDMEQERKHPLIGPIDVFMVD